MRKPVVWTLALGAALICIAAIAVAAAPFTFRHPQAPGKQFEIRDGHIVAVGENRAPSADESAQSFPQAVPDATEYDFGIMDPLTMGEHTFVIRNQGQAPLKLEKGDTTCKCTLSTLDNNEVPPGGEATVRMEWNSGSKYDFYRQAARVFTNDPENHSLVFIVQGVVRTLLGSDPPDVAFSRVEPDQPSTAEVLIYSQMWDSFSLASIDSPLEGLEWSAEPADAQRLAPWKARSGYVVRVTTPPDLPQGYFSTVLNITTVTPQDDKAPGAAGHTAAPQESETPASESSLAGSPPSDDLGPNSQSAGPQSLAIPIGGKVLRRLSVYGTGVDASGTVDAGVLDWGRGAQLKLMMKVRDTDTDLALERIEVVPKFVKVTVEPQEGVGSDVGHGLYYLNVEIPRDAPACSFLGVNQGQIRLVTGHPRLPVTELKLSFAVAPKR